VQLCPVCGTENPDRARFCLECATPLRHADEGRRADVRKTVTILFCDLSGSTALGERLDPERVRNAMGTWFAAMKTVIERHGGTVEKFIGDAVMAVFGIPVLHDDDALRAVRAAAEMQRTMDALGRQLGLVGDTTLSARIGINTGEVVAGNPADGQTLVTGDAVNVAARLEQAASPGYVLMGQSTQRLVRNAVVAVQVEPIAARGKSEPVGAWRLISVDPRAAGRLRRSETPMIGRLRELRMLRDAFERAVDERSCQLFTVLGSAGVGKSRLVQEFLAEVGASALVLRATCLPYGEGITWWPVAEIVRAAAGIAEEDSGEAAREKLVALLADVHQGESIAERVAEAIGLSTGPASQDELFWGIRRFLEALAVGRSIVIVFDDIHWAESTFLDLVEHIADTSRDASLLFLCLARPELLDSRPNWGGGKLNATTILLQPLAGEAADELVEAFPGGRALPASLRDRIREAAEGNPLFVEEMLGMLVDDGNLRHDGSGWVAREDVGELVIPPSVQALLSARLDRLAPEERVVAERASVVGRVFDRGAVIELAPEALRAGVGPQLQSLIRKELIRQEPTPGMAGEDSFRFRHLLIRDAAYEALPKAERADLHARFAGWLERAAGDRLAEYQEIVAYHLEQAVLYQRQLGMARGDTELVERASRHLEDAARHAVEKGDVTTAIGLLSRAIDLVPESDRDPRVLNDLADALLVAGSYDRAAKVLDAAETAASARADAPARSLVQLNRERLHRFLRGGERTMTPGELRELADQLAALGELDGSARAVSLIANNAWGRGQSSQTLQLLDEAIELARRAGARRTERDCEVFRLVTLGLGLTPHAEILDECAAWLAEPRGVRHAVALSVSAMSYRALGQFPQARANLHEAIAELAELGRETTALAANIGWYFLERHAGDSRPAEPMIRAAYERCGELGDREYGCTLAAALGHILVDRGAAEDALGYTEISERDSDPEDVVNEIMWRTARARAHAALGRIDDALEIMDVAIRLCEATEWPETHGDALTDLGSILEAADRLDDARAAYRRAIELYEAKGNVAAIAVVRGLAGARDL